MKTNNDLTWIFVGVFVLLIMAWVVGYALGSEVCVDNSKIITNDAKPDTVVVTEVIEEIEVVTIPDTLSLLKTDWECQPTSDPSWIVCPFTVKVP